MSREVIWLPDAVTDLVRLREFIQEKNPSAPKRAATKIKEGSLTLTNNPESGRPVDGLSSFREILIPFGAGNYFLRYREDNFTIAVVRVWHNKKERS
ncbi:type II toxin-antitoxin system RelE/ParE family toxin [Parashewanella spongiae]|uniref:Type II toxin-antitoxin system RelE/ParE family toxin n=1 Tax=Parashewanella spongiae TaxID=342950 RepID=A0A3A6TYP3_9GAMM|nr:type II toxin-antitoxin system RelE/ParE family toxin [Parashewanella spongiae]MCL1077751.1 type II toxin-antitoxin system RelE/ParE family toxin [Parashewanella spongiae]RJY18048.1 type II toxin-antitoxin system RelE/ParE family toxin [Parashewanella spongiae]